MQDTLQMGASVAKFAEVIQKTHSAQFPRLVHFASIVVVILILRVVRFIITYVNGTQKA